MLKGRKRKTKDPCPGCGLHKTLCICELTPRLNLRTQVLLLIHHRELKRTTNTGCLALRCLQNSAMRVRGVVDKPVDLADIASDGYRNLLFYPSEHALILNAELALADPRPIRLIVPDGNWRQASKVAHRHRELADVPHVKIEMPLAARGAVGHLRKEHFADGMATLEAIAHALRVIEGEHVFNQLAGFYQAKLTRTLAGRGNRLLNQL